MHKPMSVQENGTHKILCDFVIQTDPLIPSRKPDLVIITKKKKKKKRICRILDFAIAADQKLKIKEREKKFKYLDPARELRKL